MNRLLIFFLLLPIELFAQGDHLISIPISKEILKKNKVSTVNVFENVDSFMVQTNSYFIDQDGFATEHYLYDIANEGSGPFNVEKCRKSNDTAGFYHYVHGVYAEDGSLIELYSNHQYYFSPTGKLIKLVNHDYVDFHTIRMSIFDTLHPYFEDKTEWRLLNGDTLHMLKSFKNKDVYEHILKNKSNGKWVESERAIYNYKNGDLIKYQLFKNGKLVNDFVPKKDSLKTEEKDQMNENGLPIPEPFEEIVYSDKMKLIFESDVSEKNAKFRIVLHYDNGSSNELSHYEIFDNKNDLLLIKSDPADVYKTEFRYLFRK